MSQWDDPRKPTLLERIQMDWQHDFWNSRIKWLGTLIVAWGFLIYFWVDFWVGVS